MADEEPEEEDTRAEEDGEGGFQGEAEDEEAEQKKSPEKSKTKRYFDEIYGEEFGGEGMQYYPPPSDLDLLMGSESKLGQEQGKVSSKEELQAEYAEMEEEEEREGEQEEEGEGEERVEEQEAGAAEAETAGMDKESVTTISSFEYGTRISEYFVRPKEKTPSEIQFEADYREIIEKKMKKIMQPTAEVEKEKKIEEREPVQKKKLLISEVDVSGLYPAPKVIESEVSFAFDEDEEADKGILGLQKDAEITQYVMDAVRDSLKYDPDSIFTKSATEEIQKVRELVEEIVSTVRKGTPLNISGKVNDTLVYYKPNLRNTLITRLKEKLEKADSLTEIVEEEEGKPVEAEKKVGKLKKKKLRAPKKVEEIQEELEEEKLEEASEEMPEEVKSKSVEIIAQFEMKEEEKREEEEEVREEKTRQEEEKEEAEAVVPYEKIDWMQFLSESERHIAIDSALRSEMELFIAARKAELEVEQKALVEKKERRDKYRKTKDPQQMLKNLNLNVTMKFVLNTGDTFTCAYRYFMPFGEIKEDLSGIFKVPPDVLLIYRDEVEVKDEETAFHLRPEIEPFESVTFRLLTLDNDRWVLRSDHLDLPVPDIITCTVETGKDHLGVSEYKDVVVEIENRKIKKPFVGGYRDCETGVEYHHAFSQSAPHPPKLPWERRVSRDTQTAFTNSKLVDTTTDKSTQMHRRDYYVSTESDKIIAPKPYVDYDSWYKKRDIEGKVKTIQRYVRAMILRRFLRKMSEEYKKRKCWEIEQERKRIIERENRIKTDIVNMTYPKTKADFDMLYALVEKWRKAQLERIKNLKTEAPKKAELCTVLEKEIKLLEAIEVHRIATSKKQKRLKALNFMKKVAKPISWTGYRGMTIEMDTLKTQRARELKELYQSLTRHQLPYQDRIELLVSLKYALRVDCTKLTEELSDLINQECEMLIRGVNPKDLGYLRQRIEHLFGEYFKNPDVNPEAAKYDPSFNREPLKNNILFCKLCHQMKFSQNFSATVRDRSINVCSACQWLHNVAIPRVDLNPYRYILKTVRRDEQKRNCYSSCAFVLQDEDMRFLVANIWRNRSAVSENDNLFDLRMPRWKVNEDWTPWNCILLTETEAKAHLKTRPEDNYEPQLIGEVVSKHEMAKRRFQQLSKTAKRLRDSGQWANVVDVKNYSELPITADISDLTPEECLRLKGARMADGQRHDEIKNGDRPNHPEGRRLLRMPSRQPVRHRQEGLPNGLRHLHLLKPVNPYFGVLSCNRFILRLSHCRQPRRQAPVRSIRFPLKVERAEISNLTLHLSSLQLYSEEERKRIERKTAEDNRGSVAAVSGEAGTVPLHKPLPWKPYTRSKGSKPTSGSSDGESVPKAPPGSSLGERPNAGRASERVATCFDNQSPRRRVKAITLSAIKCQRSVRPGSGFIFIFSAMNKRLIVVTILFLLVMSVRGRRGRTRAKTKSRIINGLPITGKFRDPESDQYYNNNNGAKIILSSHFDYEYVLGHKIAFLCVARGNPRPQITWFKDGIELYAHYLSHVHEWKMGKDKVKSKLEIDPATQMDAGIYECSANNMYSIDSRSFKTDFSIAFD